MTKRLRPAPNADAVVAEIPTITAPRLILRPLKLSDADAIQKLFPQWEIVQFLASHVPWPYPADGALRSIRDKALPAIQEGVEWQQQLQLADDRRPEPEGPELARGGGGADRGSGSRESRAVQAALVSAGAISKVLRERA